MVPKPEVLGPKVPCVELGIVYGSDPKRFDTFGVTEPRFKYVVGGVQLVSPGRSIVGCLVAETLPERSLVVPPRRRVHEKEGTEGCRDPPVRRRGTRRGSGRSRN